MYAVFVPIGKNDYPREYEGLGNAWKPVAYFEDRDRALDYAQYLATTGEFTEVAFLPDNYITGTNYVGEIVYE